VWALVIGGLLSAALRVVASHVAIPGRRDRFGWDRAAVTLRAEYYVLRSPDGVVARGRDAGFSLSAGEGGWVVLGAP